MTDIDIKSRCRLACGAEAVLMGYPDQAGYDIHDGCVTNRLENWNEEKFIDWMIELQSLYGSISMTGYRLLNLCKRCNEVMGFYGELAESLEEKS